ncbi:MAG: ribosome-associated translation inhibitor RaiA [Prevotella sp.]|jgi:putative sigma-54 modulation protein|uniref:Ribosomal subunit interface protein n=1 Tax=uncultured Dysgonomonas sp. TaxID=206096 RepID=A0A212JQX6_9BACT|nr:MULTISPECIES: ribosome-associated translation inhibitor RaiA [unclassified Dysgonomonas]MDR1714755.1 ribosome-associated translation inhibitor RaiA [Prevotella sp.]MDR2004471.1 ribosome-associated translation inhibitor RaiA [Prevotella sp.]SBW01817.1 Ribosomal subunit interface protein [uncultured Dysgonomonas sp.]HMM03722.1 ribosome-associated translation inhibitor RaiA [Dysgonomonas sp.]
MNIAIQSVHFDASTQLKEFIEKKLSKLDKFSDLIVDAEVILKVVKPEVANNKEASVKLNIKSGELFANKTADSFEEAVMQNIEALEKQILKVKEKTQAK